MRFQIEALPEDTLQSLFELDEQALAAMGAARVIVREPNSAPCRISLADALPGETLILAPFVHQAAASPYRASGPIFVRRGVARARPEPGELPDALCRRLLSVRAYDRHDEMIDAEIVEGAAVQTVIERCFDRPETRYLHAHYARRGCYAALITRPTCDTGRDRGI
jgi:hypothetical protein